MQRNFVKRLWYGFLRIVCRLMGVALCQIRVHGRHHQPVEGSALVLSNHQSHLDPVLIGLTFRRRLNYLARQTLFVFAPLRWMIKSVDAIPIDLEGSGLGGLKETLRRLKRGEMVLIFPEGTRTRSGDVAPLKPGFCALARRGRAQLLPVGIAGAYDAWPRRNMLPRPALIHLHFGAPITPEQVVDFTDDELVDEVQRRIVACHLAAKTSLQRAKGGITTATNTD